MAEAAVLRPVTVRPAALSAATHTDVTTNSVTSVTRRGRTGPSRLLYARRGSLLACLGRLSLARERVWACAGGRRSGIRVPLSSRPPFLGCWTVGAYE